MTYKEQLQKMSNEELLHEYMLNALNYEINIGMNQIHCREELLSRLNEAERLRELVEWLNHECPEGTEETFDLSHDFTQKLRVRIERINQQG